MPFHFLHLDEVDSTNSLVMGREDLLAQAGLVVVARHQTAGRGRRGRSFVSQPGAQLLFSVVHHPLGAVEELGVVSLVTGLAVAQALEQHLGLNPRLKWPNDVLLAGRKVCGILVEMRADAGGRPRLVIGIGINCQGGRQDFPAELQSLVTTLAERTPTPPDNEQVLHGVLARLEDNLTRLAGGEKPLLLAAWLERAALVGRRLRVNDANPYLAVARGITPQGYLRVQKDQGPEITLVSGDIDWQD